MRGVLTKNFKRFLLPILLTFVGAVLILPISLAVLFPKYPAVEKYLYRWNVTTLAQSVNEGVNTLIYNNGTIFLPEGLVLNFQKIVFKVVPPSAEILCPSGQEAAVRLFPTYLKVVSNGLDCLSAARKIVADLKITEGGEIFGSLRLEGINYNGFPVDLAAFTFKGTSFEGEITTRGLTIKGEGTVKVVFGKGIYIDGTFKGLGNVRYKVQGYLPGRLRVRQL